jgi:hypothetical protein
MNYLCVYNACLPPSLSASQSQVCAPCTAWTCRANKFSRVAALSCVQVQDVFHGEMDEGWFSEIWEEAISTVGSTAAAAASNTQPRPLSHSGSEMIDYRNFVRLFDDTAADEDAVKASQRNDEEEGVAEEGADECTAAHAPPPISLAKEPQPQVELESEPEPQQEEQKQSE